MTEKLISFDIQADFGIFKKPDINEGIYLTYNCIHKPILLGILGAILGLDGYSQAYEKDPDLLPDYYRKLSSLKVGIQPLNSDKGNFLKTVIKYSNMVGYANKDDGKLLISEQTLIKPSFRIFLLLDMENRLQRKLFDYLKNNESEYLPYLGKNEFSLYWTNFSEYSYSEFTPTGPYKITTIFHGSNSKTIKESKDKSVDKFDLTSVPVLEKTFIYFENLPVVLDENIKRYREELFKFTNITLNKEFDPGNLFILTNVSPNLIVQLF